MTLLWQLSRDLLRASLSEADSRSRLTSSLIWFFGGMLVLSRAQILAAQSVFWIVAIVNVWLRRRRRSSRQLWCNQSDQTRWRLILILLITKSFIKREPLVYTRARLAVQKNKKISSRLAQYRLKKKKQKLGNTGNHNLIHGRRTSRYNPVSYTHLTLPTRRTV